VTDIDINPALVIVDYESTGLLPHADIPLELAMLVVTDELEIIDQMSMIVKPAAMPIWKDLHPSVQKMHTASGLIAAIEAGEGEDRFAVEEAFIDFLDGLDAAGLPMTGNNVANFDRPFMRVHMPDLHAKFHYRNIDVSTVKELCKLYNRSVFEASPKERPGATQAHRALEDCHATKEELAFYLDEFLMVDLV
jgi:oligoribonuclease